MKTVYFILLFLLIIGFVFSESNDSNYYITNPIQNTSFKAGSTVIVSWINGTSGYATVYLLSGISASNMEPTGVVFTVDGEIGGYEWTVPTDMLDNTTYSLMFSFPTENGTTGVSYSSSFMIIGENGSVNSSSIVNVSSYVVSSSISALFTHSSTIDSSTVTYVSRISNSGTTMASSTSQLVVVSNTQNFTANTASSSSVFHSATATSSQVATSSSATRYSSIETSTRVTASLSTIHSATNMIASSSNNSHSAITTHAQNISKIASVTPTPSKSTAPGYRIPCILIYVATLGVCVSFL
ncbi:hypothetical protein G6F56_007956 [Rhizopus delemar]|nr:hypothetical protein G6F56_007956 [Rhizopus delemar]